MKDYSPSPRDRPILPTFSTIGYPTPWEPEPPKLPLRLVVRVGEKMVKIDSTKLIIEKFKQSLFSNISSPAEDQTIVPVPATTLAAKNEKVPWTERRSFLESQKILSSVKEADDDLLGVAYINNVREGSTNFLMDQASL